jgi:hypothetical protein
MRLTSQPEGRVLGFLHFVVTGDTADEEEFQVTKFVTSCITNMRVLTY